MVSSGVMSKGSSESPQGRAAARRADDTYEYQNDVNDDEMISKSII
jgi:hypothetical protein